MCYSSHFPAPAVRAKAALLRDSILPPLPSFITRAMGIQPLSSLTCGYLPPNLVCVFSLSQQVFSNPKQPKLIVVKKKCIRVLENKKTRFDEQWSDQIKVGR